MATLNLYSLILAYSDATQNNNPGLRNVDWKRTIQSLSVRAPKTDLFEVPPGAEVVVFDGTRATSLDGTTAFDVVRSPLAADLYRFTHSGGTNPGLRTPRVVSTLGIVLTLTADVNGTLLIVAGTGTPFSAVQAGDELMIPGLLTGDSNPSPFSALNQGRWTVLAVGGSGANVTLTRPAGQDFQGQGEIVTPASDSQLYVYGQAGVQIGDKMRVTAGFSTQARRTYAVELVTSKYVEVRSTLPIPAELSVTPGAAGMQFFGNGKRFLQLEADQEATLRINGALGPELSPWLAGDPAMIASYTQVGPVYSLSVLNRSNALLNVLAISAE